MGILTHPVKLCVVVVQLSSNQQHNTDKSYKTKIEFGQTKFPTQIMLTAKKFRPKEIFDRIILTDKNFRPNLVLTQKKFQPKMF